MFVVGALPHVESMNEHAIEDVLTFWLGAAAKVPDELMYKFRRWYQGGPELDVEIAARFRDVIERALTGGLNDWNETKRGRLALVIVLDQFARNVHRGTPRAYAGDARALSLALEMLERGDLEGLSSEERLFVMMPLVHAEYVAMQERAVELAENVVVDEPNAELKAAWAVGAARTRHYRDIIRRFGRFPHRNAILGRPSTAAELAFLEEEAKAPSPLPAASADAQASA
jgi:uncharacterized protein (DUF924 family)